MSTKLNKNLVVFISTSIALMNSSGVVLADDDLSKKLANAEELITQHKAKQAAVLLREIIRSNPENAQAHIQLGAALASLGSDTEAIMEEQQGLKLDPKSYWARKFLGKMYANQAKLEANQQKMQDAINLLKEARDLKPDSCGAQLDLGTAYLAAAKDDDAITAFRKAKEIKPANVEAHVKLALLLSKKKEFPEAIVEAKEGVKLAGNQAETHLVLADTLLESGDNAGAIESYKETIAANGYDALGSKNPVTAASALSGLGWAIAAPKDAGNDKLEEATLDQRKAMKAYPPFLLAYVRLAELLARQNKNKEAESVYQSTYKNSNGSSAVAMSYAKFLEFTGRKDDAREILKKVLEKSPDNKQVSDALAALEQNKTK